MFEKKVYPDEIANFLVNNTDAATETDRDPPNRDRDGDQPRRDRDRAGDHQRVFHSFHIVSIDRDQSRVRIRAVTGEQATCMAIAE